MSRTTLVTDAEVVAFLPKTKGAIGYIAAETSATGVNTLALK